MNNDKVLATGVRGGPSLKALEEVMRERYQDLPIEKLEIYLIETVEAAALPFLAEQFNVEGIKGFGLVEGTAAQRAILNRAIDLNRFKGTPYGIREIINLAGYGNIDFIEHQGKYYDGAAFYDGSVNYAGKSENWAVFSVIISEGDTALTDSDIALIRRLITAQKNARSVLNYTDVGAGEIADGIDAQVFNSLAVREEEKNDYTLYGYGSDKFLNDSTETLNVLGNDFSIETAILKYAVDLVDGIDDQEFKLFYFEEETDEYIDAVGYKDEKFSEDDVAETLNLLGSNYEIVTSVLTY